MSTATGYSAYASTHASALGGGALEKEALLKAARLLDDARSNPGDGAALGDALRFNLDLWTIFQADVSDPATPLPDDLKQHLLSLSLFMDHSAADLLNGFDDRTLQAMIDINRTLASQPDA